MGPFFYFFTFPKGGPGAEFFFSVTSKRHFQLMGPFFCFLLSRRGGPGPLGPPESATVEAKLCIDKEAMPRCFKPQSVPFALRAKVDNELQRLEAKGVILPVEHSDWAAPIVPVLKTNGEVRICGDYKLTVTSCVYLGHRLHAEGIHPTNEKLLAFKQAPIPTCVTELRSYVGLVNYYHKFLKNVSAVLKPLNEPLQSGTSWHWGLSQQRAFEASKALLQSSKVLVHYNSRLPLVLSCGASPYGIGAVLSHRMADGSGRPIAFASRTLAPAEKSMPK